MIMCGRWALPRPTRAGWCCLPVVWWQVRLLSVQPGDKHVRVHWWANSSVYVNSKEVRGAGPIACVHAAGLGRP